MKNLLVRLILGFLPFELLLLNGLLLEDSPDPTNVDNMLKWLFKLFVTTKRNVVKQIRDRRLREPEVYSANSDLRWVVPPLLGVLHNNEEESSREDDDDEISKRIGSELNGVAIMTQVLQRYSDERVRSNAAACLMALTRTMFKGNLIVILMVNLLTSVDLLLYVQMETSY